MEALLYRTLSTGESVFKDVCHELAVLIEMVTDDNERKKAVQLLEQQETEDYASILPYTLQHTYTNTDSSRTMLP